MKFPHNQGSIVSLTATICHLLDGEPPSVSEGSALDMVISTLEEKNLPLEKCLIVAQDALGAHINPSIGKDDHGLDIHEDMDLFHCYGIFVGEKESKSNLPALTPM